MSCRRRNHKFLYLVIFLIVAVGVAFGLNYFIKNLPVLREYELSYHESLTEAERALVESAESAEKYVAQIRVSAEYSTTPTELVYAELVPVTSWYSLTESISSAEVMAIAEKITQNQIDGQADELVSDMEDEWTETQNEVQEEILDEPTEEIRLLPISELDGTQKVLAIDGHNFLDDPSAGSVFRVLNLEIVQTESSVNPKRNIEAQKDLDNLRQQLQERIAYQETTSDQILTFAQTGVTALSRAMVSKLNVVGDGAYFAENIKDFLSSKDLTHISNEVSFADNCPGGTSTVVLCSDWRMLDTITAIGTDIVELTGNHNNDYSTKANLNTIAKYEELGLKTFGGGKDEETARVPLEINQKNTKITLLGYNNSTTTAQYGGANGSTPGANLYNEEIVKSQIAEAKARGDFVIVDLQYFECYCYPNGYIEYPACDSSNNPAGQQVFFRHMIELGADMVVGTQAHQPQTFELYQGKPIFYGLGNLFFDQTYWPGTTRGLILTHYFLNGKYVQTKISPTVYGDTYQTELMDAEDTRTFLNRLLKSSPMGE